MMALLVLAALLTQEAGATEASPLVQELEAKAFKLEPVSFKIRLEAVDAAGKKTIKYEIDLYLHLSRGLMVARTMEWRPDEEARFQYSSVEGPDDLLSWADSGPGVRLTMRPMWKFTHELEGELNRLLEPGKPAQSFDEWCTSATQSHFYLDLAADKSGQGATFRLALCRSLKPGIGWISALQQAPKDDVVAGADMVTVGGSGGRKTTVIDRKTGFLRSMKISLESGEGRLLTIADLKVGAPKPDYKRPAVVRETRLWPGDLPTVYPESYYSFVAGMLQRVLDRWADVGTAAKPEALDAFLTSVGAKHDAALRIAAAKSWVVPFLVEVARRGEELPKPGGDIQSLAKRFKEYVLRGEKVHADRFAEGREEFSDRLEEVIGERTAPRENRDALSARVLRALEVKRMDSVRIAIPDANFEEMLRDALTEAEEARRK